MGREGLEPSTLGLKVHLLCRRGAARRGKCLHRDSFPSATTYIELRQSETKLYARTYAHGTGRACR